MDSTEEENIDREREQPGKREQGSMTGDRASKRHITGDRAAQAGAKRSIEPTSAFGLRSEKLFHTPIPLPKGHRMAGSERVCISNSAYQIALRPVQARNEMGSGA